MDDCLRINKPCKFEGLTQYWEAQKKWTPEYFESIFANLYLNVYVDMSFTEFTTASLGGDSFNENLLNKFTYKEFLERSKEHSYSVVLRESNQDYLDAIKSDITNPDFLNNIQKVKEIELEQG